MATTRAECSVIFIRAPSTCFRYHSRSLLGFNLSLKKQNCARRSEPGVRVRHCCGQHSKRLWSQTVTKKAHWLPESTKLRRTELLPPRVQNEHTKISASWATTYCT